MILLINYWVQLQKAVSKRPAAFRVNNAFHKISSEHEMKWKLNEAELLIPNTLSISAEQTLELFTALRWHWASLHSGFWVNFPIAGNYNLHKCAGSTHTRAHGNWFCPVAVGGDLYPSLMERFRPVWKQQGCTVTHTHTAELMEHPMLRSSQTGWRYRTLTLTARRELGPACLLSSSILPLLFSQSLTLLLCCHDYTHVLLQTWLLFSCYLDTYTSLFVSIKIMKLHQQQHTGALKIEKKILHA